MPTAVRELELTDPSSEPSRLEGYSACLLLVRQYGRPVGSAVLDVVRGQIPRDALNVALSEARMRSAEVSVCGPSVGSRERAGTGILQRRTTVAVCTRDRTADLQRCLTGLLQLPDDGQELLVVDNAPSTNATRQLVAAHRRVRYVCEGRPGLNVARNRALHEARGDVVAFCDDDAVPDRGWLRALMTGFDDPTVLAVTGLTMPLELETAAQEWFEQHCGFGRGFERIIFDLHHPGVNEAGAPGVGANMALRQTVVERVGGFDEALDAGTLTCSGGDNEMFSRILSAGHRIVYEPAALSWHRHRRTWPELRRTLYGYRVGLYAMWARQLVCDRDTSVLRRAVRRMVKHQIPVLVRAMLGHPSSGPVDLRAAELFGCLMGPAAYALSALRARTLPHRFFDGYTNG